MDTQIGSPRAVELLSRYAVAKFGDEWRPHEGERHVGPQKGRELGDLLGDGGRGNPGRTVVLINEYGSARFGDEWFPGSARIFIGRDEGIELEKLMGYDRERPAVPSRRAFGRRS